MSETRMGIFVWNMLHVSVFVEKPVVLMLELLLCGRGQTEFFTSPLIPFEAGISCLPCFHCFPAIRAFVWLPEALVLYEGRQKSCQSRSNTFRGGTASRVACEEIGVSQQGLSCGLDCLPWPCFMGLVGAISHTHVAAFAPGLLCGFEFFPYLNAVFPCISSSCVCIL